MGNKRDVPKKHWTWATPAYTQAAVLQGWGQGRAKSAQGHGPSSLAVLQIWSTAAREPRAGGMRVRSTRDGTR